MKAKTMYPKLKSAAGRLPFISLALAVAACLVMVFPSLADLLQYDRSSIAGGQWWRIATCHLTHWSLDHLFWDAIVLLVIGFVIERDNLRRLLTCMGLSAVLIPLAVWTCMPELPTYRGLSGIDSAVFMLLAVTLLHESWARRDRGWILICTAMIIGFTAKAGFEFLTGTTLFVDAAEANMLPVPLAHLIGAAIGVLCAVPWKSRPQAKKEIHLTSSSWTSKCRSWTAMKPHANCVPSATTTPSSP
ncbi:MAG: rhombosortase [Planctomycetia bacterium]|jgi:rhomboid family GlyGly-CTERM serine protease